MPKALLAFALGLTFALVPTPSLTQDQRSEETSRNPSGPNVTSHSYPSDVPAEYVITGTGYFHPSCVIQLEEGDTLEEDNRVLRHQDGRRDDIPPCKFPRYKANGEIARVNATATASASIVHSWIEDASVISTTAYGGLSATWIVPPAPASNDGQTIFFFPGLEEANDPSTWIIQPEIIWSGGAWWIRSENALNSGNDFVSPAYKVNSGDVINGQIMNTCIPGTVICTKWNVTTKDVTTGQPTTLAGTSGHGLKFNWAFGGVLEVYNVSSCSDFPSNGSLTFSGINLYDDRFNLISNPVWVPEPKTFTISPPCGYAVTPASQQVNLNYGPALGAALGASTVSGPSPLTTNLTATAFGTTSSGPINYSIWWNCSDPDTSVVSVEAQCGAISSTCSASTVGLQCDGQTATTYSTSHTYSLPGSYTAKVIIERGSAQPAQAQLSIVSHADPIVTTLPATGVVSTAATMNGSVNPNGLTTSFWFQWGTTNALGQTTAKLSGTGNKAIPITYSLVLTPGETIYYQIVAQNSAGTSQGAILSFTTPLAAPTATLTATPVCSGSYPAVSLSFALSGGTESTFDVWRAGASVSTGNTGTTFLDSSSALVAGQSYSYYVIVHLSNGSSVTSNTVAATASTTCTTGTGPTTATIPVGTYPLALAVNSKTNKIYVANYNGNSVTVINGANNSETTVTLPGQPTALAVNSVTNKVYVATSSQLNVIDGATNAVSTITIPAAANTYGIQAVAVNESTNTIYTADYLVNIAVVNGATGAVTTIPTVGGPGFFYPYLVANSSTNKVYVPNIAPGGQTGTVTILDGATLAEKTITVGVNPAGIAFDPSTNLIYVADYGGDVTIINGSTYGTSVISLYPQAPGNPFAIAVNPTTHVAYVAEGNVGGYSIITNGSVSNFLTGDTGLGAVAVNPQTNKIYFTDPSYYTSVPNNSVLVLDGATNTTTSVTVGNDPLAIAVNTTTNRVYVVNAGSNTVTVITP